MITPYEFEKLQAVKNVDKYIQEIDKKIEEYAEKNMYPWVEIVLEKELSLHERNCVAKEYQMAGWQTVYHHTSSEIGENPGLTTFVFLTEATEDAFIGCHRNIGKWRKN